MFKRYTALAALLALVLLGLWLLFRVRPGDGRLAPGAPLPNDDREQLIVDPRNHTIIIRRPSGDTVTHLPDKQTVIDVRKDGTTRVTSSQIGWELRPFVGMGYSNDAHIGVGVDGAYWKAVDLGAGVRWNFRMTDPRVFVAVSYNVKDNLRVSITIDHKKNPGLMLSIRI